MVVRAELQHRQCQLLREDPELGAGILAELQAQALRECVASTVKLRRGEWDGTVPGCPRGAGLLVLDGLLLRRVSVEERFGAELLGEGDLLRPWQADRVPATAARWQVLVPTRIAVLDELATRRLARYPEIVEQLVERALSRCRLLAANIAIVQQSGVELRILQLLWLLTERWGRVTPTGVRLPLRLTHAVIGEMVGARRPTITTALSAMRQRGVLEPLPGGGWELRGSPPTELSRPRFAGDRGGAPGLSPV